MRQLRMRDAREATGMHFVEGFRAFLQAIDAGAPIDRIVYSEVLAQNVAVQKLVRLSRRDGIPVVRVTPEQFRAVSITDRASGVGAIVRQHWSSLEEVDPCRGLCWIGLGQIRSPGNLGTIMRTAEAVSAGGLIFLGNACDPFDPAVVRASMGGLFRLRLVRTSARQFGPWARRHGCTVVGTSPSAATLHTDVPVDPPLVILFGEERAGLGPHELSVCTHLTRIPILGHADSLNVGVAAGVMLYEILRRRPAFRYR